MLRLAIFQWPVTLSLSQYFVLYSERVFAHFYHIIKTYHNLLLQTFIVQSFKLFFSLKHFLVTSDVMIDCNESNKNFFDLEVDFPLITAFNAKSKHF